ncbi:MAG: family 1 glycosylhydrolase [Spirochaetales bacterium]|nr:family 1 glycosylhydrolase [Spirochaetales bacterium]
MNHILWGAASSAYQIEGAWNRDGKGLSIWDTHTEKQGVIFENHNGRTACDHYSRFKEDVALMKEIGLQTYRFSLNWPRILPGGTGRTNSAGIDFYNALIDELLAADIQPMITLFHWEYPYELFLLGGWLNRSSPEWFEEYAETASMAFGDRVSLWLTMNEPQCFANGHANGDHAPAMRLDERSLSHVYRNIIEAHYRSLKAIKRNSPGARVSAAPVGIFHVPETGSPESEERARRKSFAIDFSRTDTLLWNNVMWTDPLFAGTIPPETVDRFTPYLGENWNAGLEEQYEPCDFSGINIYQQENRTEQQRRPGRPRSVMDWEITPEVLYWGPKLLFDRYKLPLVITENGIAGYDSVSPDGKVYDRFRIDFIRSYTEQLIKLQSEGYPVLAYCYWSVMDNFEWSLGYKERFGLIHVDYATQKRTLKESARWYGSFIKNRDGA